MGGFTLSPLYYRYILYPLGGTTFLLPLISSRNVGSNPQDAKNATHICTCGTVQAGYATLSDSRPLAQMVQRTRWAHFLWVLAGLSPLNGPDDHANDAFCFKPGIQSTRAGYFQFKFGGWRKSPYPPSHPNERHPQIQRIWGWQGWAIWFQTRNQWRARETQLIAFFTRSRIFASSVAVNSFNA